MGRQSLAALCWAAAAAVAVADGPTFREVEVYHINPYHLGAIPVNMDSGDARGDLFFDLAVELLAPLICAGNQSSAMQYGIVCKNEEVTAPDLVTNKLRLLITDDYSNYAACNVGTENNTDPFGHPCPHGTYCCVCVDPKATNWTNASVPCEAKVGRTDLNTSTKQWMHQCDNNTNTTNGTVPDYSCWNSKVGEKLLKNTTQGYWFSTLDYGYCLHHPDVPGNCTWQVKSVDKVINRTCHINSMAITIEAYNRSCFQSCGAVRNFTSPCWVRCFYTTVLGPESYRPGGPVTGIPARALQQAWTNAFETDDPRKGGCPGLPALGLGGVGRAPGPAGQLELSVVV